LRAAGLCVDGSDDASGYAVATKGEAEAGLTGRNRYGDGELHRLNSGGVVDVGLQINLIATGRRG
jgi:hypothetical protein